MIRKIKSVRVRVPMSSIAHCVFATELGWMVACGRDGVLSSLRIGYPSELSARKSIRANSCDHGEESDWCPALVRRLQQFAKCPRKKNRAGKNAWDDFADIPLDDKDWTPFQRDVLSACRRIAPGETVTYAKLAEKVGSSGAARAVGNCMARNRFPLVIPCHRVVGSNGHLGGYSAAEGISFKQRLLQLEATPSIPRP